ncbi:MAG: UPF0175 family protein [Hormoscilla sp. GUM202]|nr:UPF0175 family protein [Hormoscilla sp. GUM202]
MSVIIPDEILDATKMTEAELKQEIAVMLFQKKKLGLGKFAGMNRILFKHLLADRKIPAYEYDIKDYEHDIKTLRELGRL